jgi:hypothetical protein
MTKFFWQFKLHPDSRECTAFIVPGLGTFCYNVLPMGLKISPAVVQCFIEAFFVCRTMALAR